jgi:TRAP-type C4-dicarboxylate transport system permease small subunit
MAREPTSAALAILLCLMAFAVAFIVYTTQYLPEVVGTHFGAGNQANGWMSRVGYLVFILTFVIGMPTLVTLLVGTLPSKYPNWTNLPNKEYWLAPARQSESLAYLSAHGKRLGCLIVMFMLGIHYVILLANRMQPPTLPIAPFSSLLMGFGLALIWWIVRLYRRFPKQS